MSVPLFDKCDNLTIVLSSLETKLRLEAEEKSELFERYSDLAESTKAEVATLETKLSIEVEERNILSADFETLAVSSAIDKAAIESLESTVVV